MVKKANFEQKAQTLEARWQVLMTTQRAAVAAMWTSQEPFGLGAKKFEFFLYVPLYSFTKPADVPYNIFGIWYLKLKDLGTLMFFLFCRPKQHSRQSEGKIVDENFA